MVTVETVPNNVSARLRRYPLKVQEQDGKSFNGYKVVIVSVSGVCYEHGGCHYVAAGTRDAAHDAGTTRLAVGRKHSAVIWHNKCALEFIGYYASVRLITC